jgi:hypothetical protein
MDGKVGVFDRLSGIDSGLANCQISERIRGVRGPVVDRLLGVHTSQGIVLITVDFEGFDTFVALLPVEEAHLHELPANLDALMDS